MNRSRLPREVHKIPGNTAVIAASFPSRSSCSHTLLSVLEACMEVEVAR